MLARPEDTHRLSELWADLGDQPTDTGTEIAAHTTPPAEAAEAPYADDQFEQLDGVAIAAWWKRYSEGRHETESSGQSLAARPVQPRTRR